MNSEIRLKLVQGVLFLLFLMVLYRSAQVQLFPAKRLIKGQRSQYSTEIRKVAVRGNIFDREKKPLALTVNSYSVFVHPYQVKQKRKTARILAGHLNDSTQDLYKKMTADKPFIWLKRKISQKLKEEIDSQKLSGIHFLRESKRVYPNKTLAAHIIGFVNIDMKGLSGIENQFEDALEGVPRSVNVHKDAMGRIIYVGESAASRSRTGYHATLSLDMPIQYAVEEELKKIVIEFEAKGAMAMAMDPHSGEILASAIVPTFDPNDPSQSPINARKNRLLVDVVEPGSILKPFTLAAALYEKTTYLHKVYNCEKGKIKIGKYTITEASMSHVHDKLPFRDILKYSSNVCTLKVAFELGSEKLNSFLTLMGFGSRTGIDLPGENVGILRPWKKWSKINLATISYGHGIAVTPIQILRAYSVFANGGYLIKPHVLLKIEDETGKFIFENQELERIRVIDTALANQMKDLLFRVTEEGGTGTQAKPFGLQIPGKTGTAKKYDEKLGGYKDGAYISSFVGMFPPVHPRVVLMVMVDEPQKRKYGGEVAAPAFRHIGEKIMSILSLHPHMGQNALASIAEKPVEKRYSSIPVTIEKELKQSLNVPELNGMTLAQVREALDKLNFQFSYIGVGKVVSQTPKPGSVLKDGKTIQVVLKP
jgi:cell division protein FtsI (penicillin-binding protein 3)